MIHIQKYLLLFLRYSWVVVIIVAAAVGWSWSRVKDQPNVYGSTAVLEVIPDEIKIMTTVQDLDNNRISSLDAVYTVVETLTSNDVMLRVADQIGRTKEWAGGSPSGKVPPEKESALAQSVRNQVRVSLKRGTKLIEIVAEDTNAAMAQKIADETVLQFLKLQDQDATGESGDAIKSLLEQKEKMLRNLNDSTAKRDEYAAKKGIDPKESAFASRQSDELRLTLTDVNTRIAAIELDLSEYRKTAAGDREKLIRLPNVAALPEVVSAQKAIADAGAEFTRLKERYLERHPRYIQAERDVAEAKKRLGDVLAGAEDSLMRQLTAAKNEKTRLETLRDDAAARGAETKENTEFQALQRAVENDQALFANVVKRLSELELVTKIKKTPYKYASKPLLNPWALRPNKPKAMTDAGLLGLAIAVALILLIERLDSTIRTVDDAEKQLGIPVLAAVPDGKLSHIPQGGTVMTDDAGSIQAEAFRTLRASLSLLGDESRRRTLLVTSAVPAEGKTFCSINLAVSLAGQGYKTLLIDGDLRRPALSAALMPRDDRKAEQYRGLTDILSGNIQPAEAFRSTPIANLTLLPAGRRAPNPSELLAQATLPALIRYLEGQFDRIVFDTAPINAVSDTLGVSTHVHGVVLVVRFGKTQRRAISRATQLLKKAGAKICGVVMNRVPSKRGAAYYYYYYGDPYLKDSVYGESSKKKKKRDKKDSQPV